MILTLIIFIHIKEGTISKEQIVPMKSDLFLIRTLDKYKKFMKKSMKTKITHSEICDWFTLNIQNAFYTCYTPICKYIHMNTHPMYHCTSAFYTERFSI